MRTVGTVWVTDGPSGICTGALSDIAEGPAGAADKAAPTLASIGALCTCGGTPDIAIGDILAAGCVEGNCNCDCNDGASTTPIKWSASGDITDALGWALIALGPAGDAAPMTDIGGDGLWVTLTPVYS